VDHIVTFENKIAVRFVPNRNRRISTHVRPLS
jgi:hypothetical protein